MFIVTIISVWIKVTKDGVDIFLSLHQKYSANFLSHQLQILTRRWHFATHVINVLRSRYPVKKCFYNAIKICTKDFQINLTVQCCFQILGGNLNSCQLPFYF